MQRIQCLSVWLWALLLWAQQFVELGIAIARWGECPCAPDIR
jgi:hypothetical protein